MVEKEGIKDRLRDYLTSENPGRPEPIADDTNVFDEKLLDSLGIVRLVSFMEEEYVVEFNFDELTEDSLATLESIARLIVSKKEGP